MTMLHLLVCMASLGFTNAGYVKWFDSLACNGGSSFHGGSSAHRLPFLYKYGHAQSQSVCINSCDANDWCFGYSFNNHTNRECLLLFTPSSEANATSWAQNETTHGNSWSLSYRVGGSAMGTFNLTGTSSIEKCADSGLVNYVTMRREVPSCGTCVVSDSCAASTYRYDNNVCSVCNCMTPTLTPPMTASPTRSPTASPTPATLPAPLNEDTDESVNNSSTSPLVKDNFIIAIAVVIFILCGFACWGMFFESDGGTRFKDYAVEEEASDNAAFQDIEDAADVRDNKSPAVVEIELN